MSACESRAPEADPSGNLLLLAPRRTSKEQPDINLQLNACAVIECGLQRAHMEGVRMMPICHHFPSPYSTSSWGVFLSLLLYADNGFSSGHGKNAGIMFAIIAYCPHRKSRHLDESRPPRIRELSPFFETKVTVTDEIIVQCLMAIKGPECGCLGKVTNY